MSNNQAKKPILFFVQESWLLLVSAIVFGSSLACLNAYWQPMIQQNEIDKFNKLAGSLITEAKEFQSIGQPVPVDIGKGKMYDVDVKKGTDANGNLVGWAFVIEGSGFADKIKLVVGVDAAFEKMAGFGVLSSNETPGFGDKITIKDGFYQSQYKGAPVDELTLSKIGDAEKIDNQIIAISGATVTSEAVVKTFNTFMLPIKEAMQSAGLISNQ